jgi:dTDP-D-glucose 4,6-dehydratase
MEFTPTSLPDVILIQPPTHGDERGFVMESYRADKFAAAGISASFVQDNHSFSLRGVLRGLHYQVKARLGRVAKPHNVAGGNPVVCLEWLHTHCPPLDEPLPESPHRSHERLVIYVPVRPGHDRRYAMDIRKIGAELGWQPRETLASGLRKTVAWYLANPDWVAAIRVQPSYQDWLGTNYADRKAVP